MNPLESQAADYLRQRPQYERIMTQILRNYRRLERLGGTITLPNATLDERQALAGACSNVYSQEGALKVSVQAFCRDFCQGRFAGADFLQILTYYFGVSSLETPAQARAKAQALWDDFTQQILNATGQIFRAWFTHTIAAKSNGYRLISQLFKQDSAQLADILQALDETLRYLEAQKGHYIALPLLGAAIRRDPHYFDLQQPAATLLLQLLAYRHQQPAPVGIEAINELLLTAGIIRDEVSTAVLAFAINGTQDGVPTPWAHFWPQGEPLWLSLYNLKNATAITACSRQIYLVENPAVFTLLLAPCAQSQQALICTNGQPNTAVLLLLDKLHQSGHHFCYNGDFDPEGLQIAQKLRLRYGEQLTLWHYAAEDYFAAQSQVDISARLNKLERITEPTLTEIAQLLRQEGKAGYQELLVEHLRADILPAER